MLPMPEIPTSAETRQVRPVQTAPVNHPQQGMPIVCSNIQDYLRIGTLVKPLFGGEPEDWKLFVEKFEFWYNRVHAGQPPSDQNKGMCLNSCVPQKMQEEYQNMCI